MKGIALGIVFVLYPLIVFFGLKWLEPSILALVLVGLAILRYNFSKSKLPIPFLNAVGIVIIFLLSFSAFANSALLLKLYPVVMNLSFFSIFCYSLYKPPAVITLIAGARDKLTENAVIYTRKVTMVWSVFFICNAVVALWTVFQSDEYWALYNGLISYVFVGILFTCEWLVRRNFKKNDQSNIIT